MVGRRAPGRWEVVEAGTLSGAVDGVAGSGVGRGEEATGEAPEPGTKQTRRQGGKEEDDACVGWSVRRKSPPRALADASNVL